MSEMGESWEDREPWQCGDADLMAVVLADEREIRRRQARQARFVAEMVARGVASDRGYRDTESLLGDALVITRPEARRLVAHAASLAHLPVVASVAAEGKVAREQVAAVASVVEAMPAWATPQDQAVVEKTLAELAPTHDARSLRKWGRELLARLDQDGPEPHEPEPMVEPHNEAHIMVKPSGRVRLVAELDPEPGALLTTMISSLTTPNTHDGQPDPRSCAERAGDALADILYRVADAGSLPEDGGQKPHVTLTVSLETLQTGIGTATLHSATTDGTTTLSAAEARRIACDAEIIPMVLGSRGEPLDVGRASRTVPTAMRKAVTLRDHGHCVFPNCDRPAQWGDIHHIHPWLDQGETKIDNLATLCRRHHVLIHHSDWHMTMNDGIPTFIPPPFIDPEQKPRTNRGT